MLIFLAFWIMSEKEATGAATLCQWIGRDFLLSQSNTRERDSMPDSRRDRKLNSKVHKCADGVSLSGAGWSHEQYIHPGEGEWRFGRKDRH